jgi:hypothetical protein
MNNVSKGFVKKETHNLLKITYCSWVDKKRKSPNKEKIFHFILFYYCMALAFLASLKCSS